MTVFLVRVDSEPQFIITAETGRQALAYAKRKTPIWKGISAEPLTVAVERGAISDTLKLEVQR